MMLLDFRCSICLQAEYVNFNFPLKMKNDTFVNSFEKLRDWEFVKFLRNR